MRYREQSALRGGRGGQNLNGRSRKLVCQRVLFYANERKKTTNCIGAGGSRRSRDEACGWKRGRFYLIGGFFSTKEKVNMRKKPKTAGEHLWRGFVSTRSGSGEQKGRRLTGFLYEKKRMDLSRKCHSGSKGGRKRGSGRWLGVFGASQKRGTIKSESGLASEDCVLSKSKNGAENEKSAGREKTLYQQSGGRGGVIRPEEKEKATYIRRQGVSSGR